MTTGFQYAEAARFAEATRLIDAENSRDPNRVEWRGQMEPRELRYSRWLLTWVLTLCPHASEELVLAAHTQHICRWEILRDSYPRTRAGYLRWREDLKKFHARKSGEILRQVGYPEDMIARVQGLNLKKRLGRDPETQVLEDALCLVFLEHQLGELAAKMSEQQVLNAIRKSWEKMSEEAREEARRLVLQAREKELVDKALTNQENSPGKA